MATNKIKQFRYYSEPVEVTNASKNSPKYISVNGESVLLNASHFISGEVFKLYTPMVQLGIQSLPGTEIYINGSEEPVIVGLTGIYELDLKLDMKITSLRFSSSSMDSIKNNTSAYLIVDCVYEEQQEEIEEVS